MPSQIIATNESGLLIERPANAATIIDTSGANGVFEVWTRPPGGAWTKRTEWVGGTTVAGSAFTWSIDPAYRDGHAAIRVPTTMPGPNTTPLHDAWIYLQDFAMASSLAALPTYGGL